LFAADGATVGVVEHEPQHGPGVQVSGGGHRADTAVLFERGQQTRYLAPGRGGRVRDHGRAHDGQRPCSRQDVQRGLDQGGQVLVQSARPEFGARVRRVRQRVASVAHHRVPGRARRPGYCPENAFHADVSKPVLRVDASRGPRPCIAYYFMCFASNAK